MGNGPRDRPCDKSGFVMSNYLACIWLSDLVTCQDTLSGRHWASSYAIIVFWESDTTLHQHRT